MENTVVNLLQLDESSNVTVYPTNNKSVYVSCIKINGKPILPPLLSEEKRNELQKYKQKAIEMELKLAKRKKSNLSTQISSEISSISNLNFCQHSTPARPATLNLSEKGLGKTFTLIKPKPEDVEKYSKNLPVEHVIKSSQNCEKKLERTLRSTLEQRLANDDNSIISSKVIKYQQSPIIEEQFPDRFIDTDSDSKTERKRWSPLKIDSLNSLKIELPNKDSVEGDENVELSLDDSQNTPETVTQSPNLMRQNSYTLLTPSPALLNFLESRKELENPQRSQSGRKTWDLQKAKKNWDPDSGKLTKSPNVESSNDESELNRSKKNSSSMDSFSALQNSTYKDTDNNEHSRKDSLIYDSGTSPDSYCSKRSASRLTKLKSKVKVKKSKSMKSVPSSKPIDTVPFKNSSVSAQNTPQEFVPLSVKTELMELSDLLLKMKMDHEKQKKELEEKQQSEMKQLEIIFQQKEAELLVKVNQFPNKIPRSIYSHSSRDIVTPRSEEFDSHVMGDGSHNQPMVLNMDDVRLQKQLEYYIHSRRPHSAKDFHSLLGTYEKDCNKRTRSMDFNQANQDTDLDVSFQDDFLHSKDTTLNNEYIIESDSVSNFSSHSSTVSSETRQDPTSLPVCKKFQGISSEDFAKFNQAAMVITAAARGFLTRRLLRTAHVQGLITTLKDAINCATQLHTASDIADSDIDLMRRLGRQIEAAWDAVYTVFFNTDTTTKLQLIANDRERLRTVVAKTPTVRKKRISSATEKSLNRKKIGSLMSKSQTSNGFTRVRKCSKMSLSYPSPSYPQKLK